MKASVGRAACLLAATSLSLGAVLPMPAAFAQEAAQGAPPALVGRVSSARGTVSFHAAQDQDASDWTRAVINAPVSSGDALFTGGDGRANVEFASSLIGMDGGTELDVGTLDAGQLAASEPQGRLFVGLAGPGPGQPATGGLVATPRGTVELAAPGTYEIDAGDSATPTRVVVVQGSAHVTGGATLDVPEGETATLEGTEQVSGVVGPSTAPDPYLASMLQELQAQQAAAGRIPPQCVAMTGSRALATTGHWRTSPTYGPVWYPPVSAGWVPYREGHWSYVAPWGWTWIDDAPWGFAPFHYGRWAQIDGDWGWVPGDPQVVDGGGYVGQVYDGYPEPVYAPALVAWGDVGGGDAAGYGGYGPGYGPDYGGDGGYGAAASGAFAGALAGAAVGALIGYVALGPGEAYVPPYRTDRNYFVQINQFNVRNTRQLNQVNNFYGGHRFGGFANRDAATLIGAGAMRDGRPVRGAARDFTRADLDAQPIAGRAPLARPAPDGAGPRGGGFGHGGLAHGIGAGPGGFEGGPRGSGAPGPDLQRSFFHPASLPGGRLPFRGGPQDAALRAGPEGGPPQGERPTGAGQAGHGGGLSGMALGAAGVAGLAGAGLAAQSALAGRSAPGPGAAPVGPGASGLGGFGRPGGLPGLRAHDAVQSGRPGVPSAAPGGIAPVPSAPLARPNVVGAPVPGGLPGLRAHNAVLSARPGVPSAAPGGIAPVPSAPLARPNVVGAPTPGGLPGLRAHDAVLSGRPGVPSPAPGGIAPVPSVPITRPNVVGAPVPGGLPGLRAHDAVLSARPGVPSHVPGGVAPVPSAPLARPNVVGAPTPGGLLGFRAHDAVPSARPEAPFRPGVPSPTPNRVPEARIGGPGAPVPPAPGVGGFGRSAGLPGLRPHETVLSGRPEAPFRPGLPAFGARHDVPAAIAPVARPPMPALPRPQAPAPEMRMPAFHPPAPPPQPQPRPEVFRPPVQMERQVPRPQMQMPMPQFQRPQMPQFQRPVLPQMPRFAPPPPPRPAPPPPKDPRQH